jgi:hypothetical protein
LKREAPDCKVRCFPLMYLCSNGRECSSRLKAVAVHDGVPAEKRIILCLLDSRSLSAVVLPAEGEHLVDRGLVEAAGAEAVRKATPLQLCALLQSLLAGRRPSCRRRAPRRSGLVALSARRRLSSSAPCSVPACGSLRARHTSPLALLFGIPLVSELQYLHAHGFPHLSLQGLIALQQMV